MADISKITILNGTTYDIKDASAVSALSISGSTITIEYRDGTTMNQTLPTGNSVFISSSSPSSAGRGDVWFKTEYNNEGELK